MLCVFDFLDIVAKQAKLFLMQIDEEPLFHIDEVNPTLYNVINEINKAKVRNCIYTWIPRNDDMS